jgi:3-oxoacyl-[acyl-carrier-protein] synthase II
VTSPAGDPRHRAARGLARITGWAVDIPDEGGDAATGEHARELLGRRGLRYKESATLLALCAVHRALRLAPGAPRSCEAPDPRTGVVVSSNVGNAATVARVVHTLRTSSLRDVSLLDAPNASSNAIAASIAIWFRLGGPNLTVCSGATAGLDAVWLGSLLLRSGRVDRVVVVGVEPGDEVSVALRSQRSGGRAPAHAGAASLILTSPARRTGDVPALDGIAFSPTRERLALGDRETMLVGPAELAGYDQLAIDLEVELGDLYGALGVVQVATAATLLADSHDASSATVVCGDDVDGWRTATVCRPRTTEELGGDQF